MAHNSEGAAAAYTYLCSHSGINGMQYNWRAASHRYGCSLSARATSVSSVLLLHHAGMVLRHVGRDGSGNKQHVRPVVEHGSVAEHAEVSSCSLASLRMPRYVLSNCTQPLAVSLGMLTCGCGCARDQSDCDVTPRGTGAIASWTIRPFRCTLPPGTIPARQSHLCKSKLVIATLVPASACRRRV